MPWSVADGVYDHTSEWRSANDRVEYEHSFQQDPRQQALMQQALETASPEMPAELIRQNMTVRGVPVVFSRPQPTIETVISGEALRAPQQTLSDFSGTPAGMEGSSRNSISI